MSLDPTTPTPEPPGHPVTETPDPQTADERRDRYAAAIRDRVRFRFGASVLALAQQGRPIKMTPDEADIAADAAMAVADAEQAELRTRNARMRHELEVMYGGAFDEPPTAQTDLPASTAPAAAGHPHVRGRCPACRSASLFLGSGGYPTCARLDCPEPDAASTLLERRAEPAPPAAPDLAQVLTDLVAQVRRIADASDQTAFALAPPPADEDDIDDWCDRPACTHLGGVGVECPCPPSCGCCKATPAPADDGNLRAQLGQVLSRWGLLDEANNPQDTGEYAVTDLLAVIQPLRAQVAALQARDTPTWRHRAEQAEDLLRIAHETSNRSEAERARAVQRAEQAEAEVAELTEARQHGAFTYCPQDVGHVTVEAFARKIAEKRTALAQREQAVRDAQTFLDRATAAEAALARVREACDRLRRASVLADGTPHTDRERGAVQAVDRILAALDGPPDGQP